MTSSQTILTICLPQALASACGRQIVKIVWEDVTPDQIVTPSSVRNAAIIAMATGCSTNAVVHLIAMARRAGVTLTLEELDKLGLVYRVLRVSMSHLHGEP